MCKALLRGKKICVDNLDVFEYFFKFLTTNNGDCNWIRAHNHLVHNVSLAKWLSVHLRT